jgi:hypothetical protein
MFPWNTISPGGRILGGPSAVADDHEPGISAEEDERASLAAYRRARRRARTRRLTIGALGLVIVLVIWEIAALIENDAVFLPSVPQTVSSFVH